MFTVDVQGLDKINITLENYYNNLPKATAHALNRTLAMVKTQQTKMAREKYQVKLFIVLIFLVKKKKIIVNPGYK